MRPVFRFLAVMIALMLGTTVVAAQDDGFGEGVTLEFIGYGETAALPPGTTEIAQLRLIMEPGGSFPLDPEDPAVALVSVEAGAVTFAVDAPITVLHPAADGEPGPEDFEQFAAGEEFTMEQGDSAIFPPRVPGEARNDGEEEASLLIANIAPIAPDEATPVVDEQNLATPVN
jgi:hypothetical protein